MDIQKAAQTYAENPGALQAADEKFRGLLGRSATDPEFRRRLLTDPRGAVAEYTGKDVASVPDLNIVFIENKGAATYVLPDAIDPAAELSEKDLETVAGGISPWLAVAATALAAYDAWFD